MLHTLLNPLDPPIPIVVFTLIFGFILRIKNVEVLKNRIFTILNWLKPKSIGKIPSFLGFAKYYFGFVKVFLGIIKGVAKNKARSSFAKDKFFDNKFLQIF